MRLSHSEGGFLHLQENSLCRDLCRLHFRSGDGVVSWSSGGINHDLSNMPCKCNSVGFWVCPNCARPTEQTDLWQTHLERIMGMVPAMFWSAIASGVHNLKSCAKKKHIEKDHVTQNSADRPSAKGKYIISIGLLLPDACDLDLASSTFRSSL